MPDITRPRVLVFYLSNQPGFDRQAIWLPRGGVAYVRVEDFLYGGDLDDALVEGLHQAQPRDGESVLNTSSL